MFETETMAVIKNAPSLSQDGHLRIKLSHHPRTKFKSWVWGDGEWGFEGGGSQNGLVRGEGEGFQMVWSGRGKLLIQ